MEDTILIGACESCLDFCIVEIDTRNGPFCTICGDFQVFDWE